MTAKSSVVPTDLFEADAVDFEKLLQQGGCGDDATFSLELRTLGGSQHILHGLHGKMTIEEVKQRAADLVGAPAFTLKLILQDHAILEDHQILEDVGLATQKASVTLLRCPTDRQVWRQLFYELVTAINKRNSQDARRLIDKGAGFDDQGHVLKAAHRMRHPGDYSVEGDQPGNTMLHLAIRENLKSLALFLVSRVDDVDAPNDVGRTPLMMAICKKQIDVAEALIRAKASVSPRDYLSHGALAYAIKSGNDALLVQLVDAAGGAQCSLLRDAFDCLGLRPNGPNSSSDSLPQHLALTCHKAGFRLTAWKLLQNAGLDPDMYAACAVDEALCPGLRCEEEGKAPLPERSIDEPSVARCSLRMPWPKWLSMSA